MHNLGFKIVIEMLFCTFPPGNRDYQCKKKGANIVFGVE